MKKIRVFCTDPDATDSSSSDEDDNIPQKPTKTKRFLREVTIDTGEPPPVSPPLEPPEKEEKKYPGVRKRLSGKYTAEIRHPIKKAKIWLGSFDTAEKAYDAYCLKRLEFDALKKGDEKEVGDMEVPEGVFKVNTGKWGVMMDDPKSRVKVWLGSFESVDEAIRVYREKECEFEEMFGVKERMLSDFYGDGDSGDSCVECMEDGMWRGRVWNPELKTLVCVGRFDTREQARNAVSKEEVLFRKRFGGERVDQFKGDECGNGGKADGVGYDYSDVIIALAAPRLSEEDIANKKKKNMNLRRETIRGCDFSGRGEGSRDKTINSKFVEAMIEEKSGGVELPPGVRMTKAGRFGAWITHPVSGNEYCLRSYDTVEKALQGIKRKMAQFEEDFNSKKRARPYDDVSGTPKKAVCEAIHGSPSSVLDVRNEGLETSGTNIKTEVEYGPIHGSSTSFFKDKRVTNEDVIVHQSKRVDNGLDNTSSVNQKNLDWSFTFAEAVKLGIMNKYGQLLGEYCKCDESMWLSNRDEDEATTWYY